MLLKVNPDNPQVRFVRRAADVLRDGGVLIYPTDTTYGIGCDLFNKKAIERVYRIKEAEPDKPLSFICADLKDLSEYASGVSRYAYQTMRRLLPGPYTFVLKASRLVPKIMISRQKTVGIRIPDNRICLDIVREFGHPIINTSVSSPKDEVLSDPEQIHAQYGKIVDLVIDGGILLSDLSSVVDLSGEVPIVIREGKGDVRYFLGE